MTSEQVRRSWGRFLDHTAAGEAVAVSYRTHPRLIAHPYRAYEEQRGSTGSPHGRPVAVTSAADDAWTTATLIIVESGLAKDLWWRIQAWVLRGGHAIIQRHGDETAVLTPVNWTQSAAAHD